jgi:hypothetical protein
VPSGVQVQSLAAVARVNNLSPAYAQPWTLPDTAVQAYPPVKSEGTPAMAPANPADPAITIPKTKEPSTPGKTGTK